MRIRGIEYDRKYIRFIIFYRFIATMKNRNKRKLTYRRVGIIGIGL